MSDILVTSPFQPFTLPTQFKAVFNGYIYCGTVDAVDPSVSQVQVYIVNEAGDKVPVAQPLRTNAGGYLVYNGQPAKFVTDSNYSLLVQDQQQAQVWYAPDVAIIDPESFLASFLPGPITEVFLVPSRFPTLQAGVDWILMNRHPTNNYIAALTIETGHQPASGIVVNNANAGFIYVSSQSGTVTLSASFPTTADFIHCENGTAPVLNCLVDAAGKCAVGYIVQNNAYGKVNPGCGVKNAYGDGLLAKYGAVCNATGSVWTGAAQGGGISSGILSWAASISAESADVSGSLHYGAQSGHGGYLAFRHGMANNCGRYGIRATDMGTVDADGAQASNCGINGVRAFNLGNINARDIIATGCGSNSDANSGNISASEGSTINVTGGDISGSKQYGINANNSTVTATLANISGSFGIGVDARAASTVSLSSATVTDSGSNGINSVSSNIYAVNANLDGSGSYGIMALGASSIDAENSTARNCGTGGISSRERSSVNATNADVTGSALPNGSGLYAIGGSIDAPGAKARVGDGTTDTVKDIIVSKGGIISADSATIGGVSQSVNTLTANGIIFK